MPRNAYGYERTQILNTRKILYCNVAIWYMMPEKPWYLRLNDESIKHQFPQLYRTAKRICQSGDVVSTRILEGAFVVEIATASWYTEVEVRYKNGSIVGSTNCPCGRMQTCKHTVAALIHLANNAERLVQEETSARNNIRYLLGTLSTKRILDYLEDMMMTSDNMRKDFVREFDLEGIFSPEFYRQKIDRYFDDATYEGRIVSDINFSGIFEQAQTRLDDGKEGEAVKLYKAFAESIAESVDRISSNDGYYIDCFIEAVDGMAESVIRQNLPADKKQEYISYLLEKSTKAAPGMLTPYYLDSLEAICTARDDVVFLHDKIKPMLKEGCAVDLVHIQTRLLERLNRYDELRSLLKRFYGLDRNLCTKYLEMADDRSRGEAIRNAIGSFPDDVGVMKAALSLYPKDSPDSVPVIKNLLAATGDMKYLDRLKAASPDWESDVRLAANRFASKSEHDNAIEVYLKDGRIENAIDLMKDIGDAKLFKKHKTKLARKFIDRYTASYESAIKKTIAGRTGKEHYEAARAYILDIRSLHDDERHKEFVDEIRRSNTRRRLLLRCISDL